MCRSNSPSAPVVQPVPALRLIDDAPWEQRRPKHLLTGKVVCGVCGGLSYARGSDCLGCHAARRSLCRNTSSGRRGPLEERVMEALEAARALVDRVVVHPRRVAPTTRRGSSLQAS